MHCSAFSSTLHEIFSNYGSKSAQSLSFFIDYFRILHNALPSHPMSTSVPETLYPPKKKPTLSIHSLESMWWLEKGRVSFPTAIPLLCTSKKEPANDGNQTSLGHQHGFRQQLCPWIFTQASFVAQFADINTIFCPVRTTDPLMAHSSCMYHRPQNDFQRVTIGTLTNQSNNCIRSNLVNKRTVCTSYLFLTLTRIQSY